MTVYPHERTVTCDQHRICTYCGEKIPCGSKYMYWSFIDEYGERSKNAMHLECEEKFRNSGNEYYDYHVNKRPITAKARFDNECVLSRMFDFIRSLKRTEENQQWYYRIYDIWEDDVNYVVTCPNRIAAINDARDHIKENFNCVTEVKFSIGRCQHPLDVYGVREVFETLVDVYDGEFMFGSGESGCLSMSVQNIDALNKLVFDFIHKNADVEYWVCDDPAEETHFCKGCQ